MEMTNPEPPDEDVQEFVRRVTSERLAYLKYLKFRGISVDDSDLQRLEDEVADGQNGESTLEMSVADLQQQLAFVDLFDEGRASAIKALLYRLGHIKVRMWPERNHHRPHFHIEYKREYSASYSVDSLERLAGEMPRRYEKPILIWASANRKLLTSNWQQLNDGTIELDGA